MPHSCHHPYERRHGKPTGHAHRKGSRQDWRPNNWYAPSYFTVPFIPNTMQLGVLTKPDSLTSGATSQFRKWKSIMSGENLAHALRLGYYCVKLPDDAQRTADMMTPPSRGVRQAREMQFFQSTEPWSSMPNKLRFGVVHLLDELSKNLVTMLDAAYVLISGRLFVS